jgi:uncharacterized protein (DUF885 family)
VALDARRLVRSRTRGAIALAAALGIAGGCRRPTTPTSPAPVADAAVARPRDANSRLDDLVREHIDASLAASPTMATWLGVHAFDERLDELTPEAQSRDAARWKLLLAHVAELPDEELDDVHRVDRTLLERDARLGLLEIEARPLERNPIRYVDLAASGVDELLSREFAPLPERLHAVDARLLRLRTLFEEARRNLKSPPELYTRKAIELAQGTRGFFAETLPAAVAAVGDDKLTAEFRFAQADALRALDELIAWMQRDLLPRSKGELALGRDRFLERLRVSEGVDLPLDQLLALAEREVRTARLRYEETARAVAPGRSPADAPRALEDDHPTAEQLLPSTSAAVAQAAEFVGQHHLATLPRAAPPSVVEMPPFLWGFTTLSMPGPLEARTREARFYVDPVDRSWNSKKRDEHLRAFNRAQMLVAALHEVIPGHWRQGEAARSAPSAMQRFARSDVFVEGWAHYAEQMMLDEGFGGGEMESEPSKGSEPPAEPANRGMYAESPRSRPGAAVSHQRDLKLRLAWQREALVRLCRLVAAIRLHALGARLDDVARIFNEEAYLDEYAARREAERGAYDPMYLGHALGKLQILKLREDVRSERGDAFRLGEFHDQLLAHGAAPVHVLRRILLPGDSGPTL